MDKRILIVDDDPEILDLLQLSIRVWSPDYKVTTAANGLEALIQLQLYEKDKNSFELVLTDYDMPLMNGLDLASEVRRNWPDTHIILMSGGRFDVDMEDIATSRQFDGYLRKPFMMQQVKNLFLEDSAILH